MNADDIPNATHIPRMCPRKCSSWPGGPTGSGPSTNRLANPSRHAPPIAHVQRGGSCVASVIGTKYIVVNGLLTPPENASSAVIDAASSSRLAPAIVIVARPRASTSRVVSTFASTSAAITTPVPSGSGRGGNHDTIGCPIAYIAHPSAISPSSTQRATTKKRRAICAEGGVVGTANHATDRRPVTSSPCMSSTTWSLDLYHRAARFAARAHLGQKIPGGDLPYVLHVVQVTAEVLGALAVEPVERPDLAVACALLHDVVEDTTITADQVAAAFGPDVAAGVLALSKDPSLPKDQAMPDSLRRIRDQPREVWLVKLADRIVNLEPPPYYWKPTKIAAYREEAGRIADALGDASPHLHARLRGKIAAYPPRE